MPIAAEFDDLSASLARLAEHGVVPGIAGALQPAREAMVAELAQAASNEVPAYRESGNPDVVPELAAHLGDIIDAALALLGGEPVGSFDFVGEHARLRAAQKFPLDAIHHAYRCAHRLLSRRIRDAALATAFESAHVPRVVSAAADFSSEFLGAVSTLLTNEYVAHTRALAEAEGDRRQRLMDTLLKGYDESDRIAAQLLRAAGYLEQRQSYCVALARSVDPREMASPARAQRMAEAMSAVFAGTPFRVLAGVRDEQAVAIVSGTRRLSGWTAPQSLLAERIEPLLRKVGPAALIGLSNDVPSTSHIPRAAKEASLALDFADVAHRVVPYASIPFTRMLVTHARPALQSSLPAWLDAFTAADGRSRGALVATLRAYADADMNVLKTAGSLGIHPNTIYARMRRIRELTGLEPLQYHALTEMLLAIGCAGAETTAP
jgi:hypothetical protein